MDDAELKRLAEAATPGMEWYDAPCFNRPGTHPFITNEDAAFLAAANPSTILRLLRERDELAVELMDNSISAAAVAIQLRRERAEAASAQHDAEVYRDAVIEAREHGRALAKDRDCASAGEDLLYIFEDLHGLPGEGEGS